MAIIGENIDKAREVLLNGGLIGMPTETVYGLAANALNLDAVSNIFKVKNRPSFDPLIVHTYSIDKVMDYTLNMPKTARVLAERLWPGPLTLLLEKKEIIPDLVTSGMSTVAIRVPEKEITLELLSTLAFPLVAPSANPFGYVSPTTAQHVNDQLGTKIEYILEGGDCEVGLESTIVGFPEGKPTIYRLGGVSKEKIESLIGHVDVMPHSSSNPKAPGMLKSHYSPAKKVIYGALDTLLSNLKHPERTGIIAFDRKVDQISEKHQIVLAPDGDLTTAAKNLFSALRQTDQWQVDVVIAEEVPNNGLGLAINDRLKRASA